MAPMPTSLRLKGVSTKTASVVKTETRRSMSAACQASPKVSMSSRYTGVGAMGRKMYRHPEPAAAAYVQRSVPFRDAHHLSRRYNHVEAHAGLDGRAGALRPAAPGAGRRRRR